MLATDRYALSSGLPGTETLRNLHSACNLKGQTRLRKRSFVAFLRILCLRPRPSTPSTPFRLNQHGSGAEDRLLPRGRSDSATMQGAAAAKRRIPEAVKDLL